jgi:hypothetical protein
MIDNSTLQFYCFLNIWDDRAKHNTVSTIPICTADNSREKGAHNLEIKKLIGR